MLTALTNIATNKKTLIDKISTLQNTSEETLYKDAETKLATSEAFKQRQNQWRNAKSDQERKDIINMALT